MLRIKFAKRQNAAKLQFRWLKARPKRDATEIFVEFGREGPYVYLGILRFVVLWDLRPRSERRLSARSSLGKILSFRGRK